MLHGGRGVGQVVGQRWGALSAAGKREDRARRPGRNAYEEGPQAGVADGREGVAREARQGERKEPRVISAIEKIRVVMGYMRDQRIPYLTKKNFKRVNR